MRKLSGSDFPIPSAPPPSRTKWTRLVHPFVLTGHVSSSSALLQSAASGPQARGAMQRGSKAGEIGERGGSGSYLQRAASTAVRAPLRESVREEGRDVSG